MIIFYESWKISVVLQGMSAKRRLDEVISWAGDVETVLLEAACSADFYVSAADVFL